LEAAAFKPTLLDTVQAQIPVGKVPQLQNVVIRKVGKAVGIKAVEGHTGAGIYIVETVPGSPAGLCTELRPGTTILSINGQSVTALTKMESVNLLKAAKKDIELAIRYDPLGYARAITKSNATKPIVAPGSQPVKVKLQRGLKGATLGMRLVGSDTGAGVYLAGLLPGTPAWDAQASLKVGMQFLVVNKKIDERDMSKI
jgi:C-terminal processing protease CtpA/Prc